MMDERGGEVDGKMRTVENSDVLRGKGKKVDVGIFDGRDGEDG